MSYALVIDSTVDAESGALPSAARRLDTQQWVLGLPDATAATQQACGWYAVVDTAQPTPAAGHTSDRSVQLVNGTPTVVWTDRLLTPDEQTAQAQQANQSTIEAAMDAALAQLQTYINAPDLTFTNIATGVQALQTLQHAVQKLALIEKQIIRYLRGDFDGTS